MLSALQESLEFSESPSIEFSSTVWGGKAFWQSHSYIENGKCENVKYKRMCFKEKRKMCRIWDFKDFEVLKEG